MERDSRDRRIDNLNKAQRILRIAQELGHRIGDYFDLPDTAKGDHMPLNQRIAFSLSPPADTPYEYAFPFSAYSGPAAPAGPILEAREALRTRGLSSVLGSESDPVDENSTE